MILIQGYDVDKERLRDNEAISKVLKAYVGENPITFHTSVGEVGYGIAGSDQGTISIHTFPKIGYLYAVLSLQNDVDLEAPIKEYFGADRVVVNRNYTPFIGAAQTGIKSRAHQKAA